MVRRAVLAIALLLIPGIARAASHPSSPDLKPRPAQRGEVASRSEAGEGVTVLRTKDPSHRTGGATAAKSQGKGAIKKPKKVSRYAAVELYQINTKETLLLRFQDDRGRPIKGWKKRFDKFMRCHQTGTVFKMDARLPHMLYETARHYEGHRMEVVSGYRHPKVARNPKSPHKKGLACDFRMAGIPNAALRDWLRKTFDHAGVGYYPNSVFVHLDNRKDGPSAFWIDYAGPGQSASYAENPREDLRNGRAERTRASGDEVAGRAEGEDDMAQAGEASAQVKTRGGAVQSNVPGRRPVEVKSPSDPFGD